MNLFVYDAMIFFIIGLACFPPYCSAQTDARDSGAKKCYEMKPVNLTEFTTKTEPCKQKFTQRCGWFSLSYCTAYRTGVCHSSWNGTYEHFSQVEVCCPGFKEGPNGECVVDVEYKSDDAKDSGTDTKTQEIEVETENIKEISSEPDLKLPHGAYAGIACAVIFIIAFTTMTVLGVRKRKRRQALKSTQLEMEQADQHVALNVECQNELSRTSGVSV